MSGCAATVCACSWLWLPVGKDVNILRPSKSGLNVSDEWKMMMGVIYSSKLSLPFVLLHFLRSLSDLTIEPHNRGWDRNNQGSVWVDPVEHTVQCRTRKRRSTVRWSSVLHAAEHPRLQKKQNETLNWWRRVPLQHQIKSTTRSWSLSFKRSHKLCKFSFCCKLKYIFESRTGGTGVKTSGDRWEEQERRAN